MTDRPLDDWRDSMIMALYGELSADRLAKLEARLDEDEVLRREWHELGQTRAVLQRLAEAEVRRDAVLEATPPGPSERPRPGRVVPLWRWALASAAGVAAAATVFFVLLLAGLRVDSTREGLLVRFGRTGGAGPVQSVDLATARTGGVPPAVQPYLTRAEFAGLAQMLMDSTTVRLDELERRQSSVQLEMTQALYEALAVRQQRQYDDLKTQIQLAAMRASSARSADDPYPLGQQWTQEDNNATD